MTEYVPRITAQTGDPDQEHIDAAVADMNPGLLAEWKRMHHSDEIRKAYAHLDRDTLESRLAFEWKGGVEKRVKLNAWQAQNQADKIAAIQKTAKASEGALAAMQHVLDLRRQGRKTVKVEDLIDIYNTQENK